MCLSLRYIFLYLLCAYPFGRYDKISYCTPTPFPVPFFGSGISPRNILLLYIVRPQILRDADRSRAAQVCDQGLHFRSFVLHSWQSIPPYYSCISCGNIAILCIILRGILYRIHRANFSVTSYVASYFKVSI